MQIDILIHIGVMLDLVPQHGFRIVAGQDAQVYIQRHHLLDQRAAQQLQIAAGEIAAAHIAAEQRIALEGIRALEQETGMEVFISVEPFKSFYSAEEEHQDYYRKHPEEFRQELIDSGRVKP